MTFSKFNLLSLFFIFFYSTLLGSNITNFLLSQKDINFDTNKIKNINDDSLINTGVRNYIDDVFINDTLQIEDTIHNKIQKDTSLDINILKVSKDSIKLEENNKNSQKLWITTTNEISRDSIILNRKYRAIHYEDLRKILSRKKIFLYSFDSYLTDDSYDLSFLSNMEESLSAFLSYNNISFLIVQLKQPDKLIDLEGFLGIKNRIRLIENSLSKYNVKLIFNVTFYDFLNEESQIKQLRILKKLFTKNENIFVQIITKQNRTKYSIKKWNKTIKKFYANINAEEIKFFITLKISQPKFSPLLYSSLLRNAQFIITQNYDIPVKVTNRKNLISYINAFHSDNNMKQYSIKINEIEEQLSIMMSKHVHIPIILLNNKDKILPLENLEKRKIIQLCIETKTLHNLYAFHKTLNYYTKVDSVHIAQDKIMEYIDFKNDSHKLKNYNTYILNLYPNHNIDDTNIIKLIEYLDKNGDLILNFIWNGKPKSEYEKFYSDNISFFSFQNTPQIQSKIAQLIFGGRIINYKNDYFSIFLINKSIGVEYKDKIRVSYNNENKIFDEKIKKIESIILEGIKDSAYPGCQIFIAKNSNVILNKSYGYHTYDNKIKVNNNDLYDIASITKIAASIISIMKLDNEHILDLDNTLGDIIPELVKNTPYAKIVLREMLAHQSGLPSWIPFYKFTLGQKYPRFDIYSLVQNETYSGRVCENMYIIKDFDKVMFDTILKTPLLEKKYLYSDLGYYFLKYIIEKNTSMSLDDYVQLNFYKKLGMNRTTFKPLEKFSLNEIIPTENDKYFRRQLIHGDVHDPGAAMLGGVGGHAGLFSTANDLGKLMQMLMQYGIYGNKRFFDEEIVKEYTDCQFCSKNRRGAGFDKPEQKGKKGPTCNCISYASFGHTGFTGTIAWADPEDKVIFIFLSNRIYPTAENEKLVKKNIRTRIMEEIYK